MPEPEFDQLVDQLLDSENPRTRREAARKLGALRTPMAIAFLVEVYTRDSDKSVQQAARDALLIYRRMEAELASEQGAAGGKRRGGVSSELLLRVRRLLLMLLILTIVANIGLFAARRVGLGQPQPTPDTQVDPTPREMLIAGFRTRIEAFASEGQSFRTALTTFGAEVLIRELPRCTQPTASQVATAEIARIDRITYPDLGPVNDAINAAAVNFLALRRDYLDLCEIKNYDELKAALDKAGGSGVLVQRIDEILNKDLNDARSRLDQAILNPAPTVGPTFTPTVPSSPTPVPTAAPGAATAAVTDAAATPPPGATPTPASPTETPTITPTPTPALVYSGLRLDTFARYRYRLNLRYAGVTSSNQPFDGTLQILVTYQGEPLIAQYDISISEDMPFFQEVGWLPSQLYVRGNSSYVIKDGVLYQTGAILRPPTRCEAFRVNDANLGRFRALILERDFVLPVAEMNQIDFRLFGTANNIDQFRAIGEFTDRDGLKVTNVYDLYVAVDTQVPVRYTLNRVSVIPPGFTKTALTELRVDYQLLGFDDQINIDQVTVEIACRNVQPR